MGLSHYNRIAQGKELLFRGSGALLPWHDGSFFVQFHKTMPEGDDLFVQSASDIVQNVQYKAAKRHEYVRIVNKER